MNFLVGIRLPDQTINHLLSYLRYEVLLSKVGRLLRCFDPACSTHTDSADHPVTSAVYR